MKYLIIIPLYKDWDNLEILLPKLKVIFDVEWCLTKVLVVDDFSLQKIPEFLGFYNERINVIELTKNMGHQKAIAIGLSYAIVEYPEAERIVIMDSDGEDKPSDIPYLLSEIKNKSCSISFAHRYKRNEVKFFLMFYMLYKKFFFLLTGQKISFGNFCVMTNEAAKRLVHVSEIWLHFSSGVIKSKIPYITLPTERGKRYSGKSKMNFTGLVNHGLSAIAVYSEFVAVRITLMSIILSLISVLGIFVLFGIKQLTNLAIPGWTSFVTLGLLNLIAQLFTLGILLSFVVLSSKTLKNINPVKIYKDFIYKVYLP